uniref:Putative ovule protein n=1 Tax=Solanum chacoense TaxID=4108 RepID=A0A0V0HEU1_SOLCH
MLLVVSTGSVNHTCCRHDVLLHHYFFCTTLHIIHLKLAVQDLMSIYLFATNSFLPFSFFKYSDNAVSRV